MQALSSGPFVPGQTEPVRFAFCADDCALHFDEANWTDKQRADHRANVVLTAMLQVALHYMGRRRDFLTLHNLFREPEWAEALRFYQTTFASLFGGDVITGDNVDYFPSEGFYEAVAGRETPAALQTLYMISGSNQAIHGSDAALRLSRQVNSKMHFAEHAPAAGIPVPATMVSRAPLEGDPEAEAFFARHGELMVKTQGLAGARNVVAVSSMAEAQQFLAQLPHGIEVLLQERLDSREYIEMTVDLTVTDRSVEITNLRQILFAEGLWVGNYLSPTLELTGHQSDVCLKVGQYVQQLGYAHAAGLNCGIDFFVRGDEIVVTEINARWTGGLFPAYLLERLRLTDTPAVAFIDMLSPERFAEYRDFIAERCVPNADGYRLLPMGFSPFVENFEGAPRIYVWQVVSGDFEAFRRAKRSRFGEDELPTVELITLPER